MLSDKDVLQDQPPNKNVSVFPRKSKAIFFAVFSLINFSAQATDLTNNDLSSPISDDTSYTNVTIVNNRTLSSGSVIGGYVYLSNSITGDLSFTNSGSITSTHSNYGVLYSPNFGNSSSLETFGVVNDGSITTTGDFAIGIYVLGKTDGSFPSVTRRSFDFSLTNSGTISSAAQALYIINGSSGTFDINNSGTIASSNASSSGVISLSSGSIATITNSGTGMISGDKAITTSVANTTITNSGLASIVGSINASGGSSTRLVVINDSTGGIDGNIYVNDNADLDVTNDSGTITGNITLGNNSSSSVTINDGYIVGDITMNNALQSLNLNGGTINGAVSGLGMINVSGAATIDGDLTTVSGSTISTTVNSSSSIDTLTVSGAAVIASGTKLSLTVSDAAVGSSYTVVDGGSGSSINAIDSANISVNGGNNRYGNYIFRTAVSGNDLLLTTSLVYLNTTNGNRSAVYNSLVNANAGSSGGLYAMQNYIYGDSSDSAKNSALDTLMSQVDNSSNRIVFNNLDASANVVANRLNNLRGNRSGVSSGDAALEKSVWAEAFGSKTNQQNTDSDGYKADSGGFAIGADKKIDKELTVGIAGIYSGSAIKANLGNKKTSISSYQVNLYSGHNFEQFFINNVAGVALNQYSSSRTISVSNSIAQANYSGASYVLRSEFGTNRKIQNDFLLTPSLMITAARNTVDNYDESGAGSLNLHVKNNSTNFLEGRVGTSLSKNYHQFSGVLTPSLSASYGYDFIGKSQKTTANFIGQNSTFSSNASKIAQGSLKLGAGLKFYSQDGLTLSTDYVFEQRTKYKSNTGFVRAKYNF